ncbi:MAG: hypothetical protein QOC69_4131, partial [Mycobacterium sp.]|nr:hypothetical protein [Mycobacterium sp.]
MELRLELRTGEGGIDVGQTCLTVKAGMSANTSSMLLGPGALMTQSALLVAEVDD